MRKEIVVPVADLLAEAEAHFAVKGKVKLVGLEKADDGEVINKELHYGKGKTKLTAPLRIAPIDIWQNNRPHSLRRLVRERYGKALHHLIAHGARFAD